MGCRKESYFLDFMFVDVARDFVGVVFHNNNNTNTNNNKHLYSAYEAALYALHNINTIVKINMKNKN